MIHSIEHEKIVCFSLGQTSNLYFSYFFINPNTYKVTKFNNSLLISNNNYKGIKSIVTMDKKKCLVCMYFSDPKVSCLIYSIDSNNFAEQKYYNVICTEQSYSLTLEYYRETKEYIVLCTGYSGEIMAVIFNENLTEFSEYNIIKGNGVITASIIYSHTLQNYYVISDININEVNKTFIPFDNKTRLTTYNIIDYNITEISESIIFNCTLEKCKSCDNNSFSKNLCTECNKNKKFYQINPLLIKDLNLSDNNYIDCYNNSTKPTNFYFNKTTEFYELCYKSCASCEYGGDGNQNNCTTCDVDLMKEPEKKDSKNCVAICTYFYYYNSYGQYKCTTLPQCPDDYNLLIREKRKCIDNCQKDSTYKYQYNGECYEKCPKDTNEDNIDHICKVINIESCTMSSSQFELNDFLKEGGVEKIAKTYAKEFNYTSKHISLLNNEVYSIMLYKDKDCINELGLSMPEIDFGECYEKVQYEYKLENKDLIVAIIDKKSNKRNNPITSYIFYNPESGD